MELGGVVVIQHRLLGFGPSASLNPTLLKRLVRQEQAGGVPGLVREDPQLGGAEVGALLDDLHQAVDGQVRVHDHAEVAGVRPQHVKGDKLEEDLDIPGVR